MESCPKLEELKFWDTEFVYLGIEASLIRSANHSSQRPLRTASFPLRKFQVFSGTLCLIDENGKYKPIDPDRSTKNLISFYLAIFEICPRIRGYNPSSISLNDDSISRCKTQLKRLTRFKQKFKKFDFTLQLDSIDGHLVNEIRLLYKAERITLQLSGEIVSTKDINSLIQIIAQSFHQIKRLSFLFDSSKDVLSSLQLSLSDSLVRQLNKVSFKGIGEKAYNIDMDADFTAKIDEIQVDLQGLTIKVGPKLANQF